MSEPSPSERALSPEWSPFTESAEFERFWGLVVAAASQHGSVEELPDTGVIRVGQAPGHIECGLLNLAQSCATAGSASWEEIVERHFELVADSPMRRIGRLTESFATARPHLRARVVHADVVDSLDGNSLPLPSGMAFGLALDVEGHSVWLGEQHTGPWNRSVEELLLGGAVQVRKRVRLRSRVERMFGGRVTRLAGRSLFVTGHLFDLARHLGPPPESGALVAAPTAREMLVAPLDDETHLVNDAAAIVASAVASYAEGPNSLTPDVWWWRPGEDFALALRYDGRPRFEGPPALQEIFAASFDMDA